MNRPDDFQRIYQQLVASKRISEILDVNGEIQPSSDGIRRAQFEHAQLSIAEKWQLTQTFTPMELAEKN